MSLSHSPCLFSRARIVVLSGCCALNRSHLFRFLPISQLLPCSSHPFALVLSLSLLLNLKEVHNSVSSAGSAFKRAEMRQHLVAMAATCIGMSGHGSNMH
mmetsp:Transcript_22164/g.48333  ORF Transcript_22164/g.48333 Transcript_22164/m.48333 type:complete len:100 (-) Transcript_22164:271-570(-)